MGQNTENEADLDITLIRAQTIATSTSFPATVEVPVDDLSAVVIPATKALRAVLEELGGSGPTYEHVSSREFKVHFQIMLKGHSFGIVVPVKFVDDILAEEGWEHCARIALRYLRDDDDIGIHAVDYNWSTAEEIRKRCSVLLETLIESEEIYDFIKSKSYVVADGIKLAADIFESKGFEMANEMFADPPPPFEDFQFYAVMTGEYRYCVEELWSTRNRCYCYMERQHSLYQLLRDLKRSAFRLKMKTYESMPYANYVKVNNKETATIVSSVIKMILEEVASKAGFQIPVLRIDHVFSSGHRASVQLTTASEIAEASNAVTHFIQGKVASDKHEAANSAMYAAVHLLVHKYGVEIIDPSTYMLRDLKHLERAIQAEIQLIPESLDWFHKIARDALHETYELADRYNGSICEMDAKINGLLISMCYDLAQHTDAFYENSSERQ